MRAFILASFLCVGWIGEASSDFCGNPHMHSNVMCAGPCSENATDAWCNDPHDPGVGNLSDGTPPVLCLPLDISLSAIHCRVGCERTATTVQCKDGGGEEDADNETTHPVAGSGQSPSLDRDQVIEAAVDGRTSEGSAGNTPIGHFKTRLKEIVDGTHKHAPIEAAGLMGEMAKKWLERLDAAEMRDEVNYLASLITGSNEEFRITNYGVGARAMEGIGSALKAAGVIKNVKDFGEAVSDFSNDKIDAYKLAERVGPIPAKIFLGVGTNIPFSGELLDLSVAGANLFIEKAMDGGFYMYDRYNGWQ